MSDEPVVDSPIVQRRMSLRGRIALLSALAVAVAITVTTLAVFLIVREELYEQFDKDLLQRTYAAASDAASSGSGYDNFAHFPAALAGNADVGLLSPTNVLTTSTGGTPPPASDTELAVAQGNLSHSLRTITANGEQFRVASAPAGPLGALVIAQPTAQVHKTLSDLTIYLTIIGLLGVACAGALGYLVARTGLRPVADLTAATERVRRTSDLTPIRVTGDDEVARLAESFNAMLTSLDAARDRERRLVADAGHELRTPLTSIRTNLDLLAQSEAERTPLPSAEKHAMLDDARAQITELSELVGDLIQLSRGEPEDEPLEHLDFSAVVVRATDRVKRRAPGIGFDTQLQPWWLDGSPVLLERAVTNILGNAVKWSPSGGTIRVTLHDGVLTVTDEGPGIPEGEQAQVFERFYRSPASRGTPGSGLGLAIVAQAAERHGGTVQAGTAPEGGAQIVMTLPGDNGETLGRA